jgi:hypothetical protein
VLIINPASGPGAAVDANYAAVAASLRASGVTVLGYVHTAYAQRASSLVTADIDK